MNKCIESASKECIINDFPEPQRCLKCIRENTINGYAQILCRIDKVPKRIALYHNVHGRLYCCSSNSKTTKNFRLEVESIGFTLKSIIAVYKEVVTKASQVAMDETAKRTDRVIHNLRSNNAHSMQTLYTLIPQNELIGNIRETSKIVAKYIEADPQKAAMTFLKIAKLNMSVKAEFSIYDKILKGNPKLDFRQHNPREIIMIIMYMFFADFSEINVRIHVEDFYDKIKIDYESVQVALYHIVENAAKYIKPNTEANITFMNNPHSHTITFSMCSLYIAPDEEDDIFDERYSGLNAKKIGKSGTGIGLYRARKLIALNNGEIELEPGDKLITDDKGVEYANNKFIITFAQ